MGLVQLRQFDLFSSIYFPNYKLCDNTYKVASYLMRITQIHDQLVTIGEVVDDTKLVNVALNGFPGTWEPFVQGICA